MHLFRTLSKEVSRSTATKVESGISDANRRSLVCERRVKKDKTLVEKSRSSLSQLRAAEHPIQLVKKQRTELYRHQSRSGISDANRRFLVCECLETGKEGQYACQKIQIEFVSKDIGPPDAVGEETKNRALEPASFREEVIANQSQRKAKSKYGICAGFWLDRLGH